MVRGTVKPRFSRRCGRGWKGGGTPLMKDWYLKSETGP